MTECHKIRFTSKGEANKYARRIAAANGSGRLRPYECDAGCASGVWHLTSQSAAEARRLRKRAKGRGT